MPTLDGPTNQPPGVNMNHSSFKKKSTFRHLTHQATLGQSVITRCVAVGDTNAIKIKSAFDRLFHNQPFMLINI